MRDGGTFALILQFTVHAEDELGSHAHLYGKVGGICQLLHSLEGGQELGVAGGGGGVEVDAVGSHFSHLLGDIDHVAAADFSCLHLGFSGFLDHGFGQEVGRVAEGAVGIIVESQIGHGSVVYGNDRALENAFYGLTVSYTHLTLPTI